MLHLRQVGRCSLAERLPLSKAGCGRGEGNGNWKVEFDWVELEFDCKLTLEEHYTNHVVQLYDRMLSKRLDCQRNVKRLHKKEGEVWGHHVALISMSLCWISQAMGCRSRGQKIEGNWEGCKAQNLVCLRPSPGRMKMNVIKVLGPSYLCLVLVALTEDST